MPEPILFWLTVILLGAAVIVGALALWTAIRLMAKRETQTIERVGYPKHPRPPEAHA